MTLGDLRALLERSEGNPLPGSLIPLMGDGQAHELRVVMDELVVFRSKIYESSL
jgi:hypothetical protein